jgi:type VI protein secretion system component VasK
MGATRALGALLLIVCIVVIVAYLGWLLAPSISALQDKVHIGPITLWPKERGVSLWIALPVILGVWVVCGLGAWLGWIMATTKEVAPVPVEEKKEEKAEKEEEKPVSEKKKK